MIVGPEHEAGDESFDVMVCTRWLERHVRRHGPLIARHYVVTAEWNPVSILSFLTDAIERQSAPTWPELGEKLSRIGLWEFEEYVSN